MAKKKLPLPFTILINAVAYPTGYQVGVFANHDKLLDDLEKVIQRHAKKGVLIDCDITAKPFVFRHGYTADDLQADQDLDAEDLNAK